MTSGEIRARDVSTMRDLAGAMHAEIGRQGRKWAEQLEKSKDQPLN
jgi:hypothetical protein